MTAAEKTRQRREQDAARKANVAVPQRHATNRRETITPEIATAWLERNRVNRKIVQSTVDRYARDMKHGRWHLTGDSIKFGITGILIDGQHRLWGCVEAGVAFETYVVRGLVNEAEVRDVIDTGLKRTLGNALQIHGEKDTNHLAAVISMCWRYDNFRLVGPYPTHEEGLAYLGENPTLRDAVMVGRTATRALKLSTSAAGAAYWLNARVDEETSHEFWVGASTGEGLPSGSPVLAFRRWAIQAISRREKPRPETVLTFALKAMNAYRTGKSLRVLQVKDIEGIPEAWS